MRYQVPQFIEVEDKIFGPLTLKQFVYLVGGAGLSFILFTFLPLFIAVILIAPVVALSLGLAFYKVNRRPLIETLESGFRYAFTNKLYLWDAQAKKEQAMKKEEEVKQQDALVKVPSLSRSKLKDLAWSLDIQEKIGGVAQE